MGVKLGNRELSFTFKRNTHYTVHSSGGDSGVWCLKLKLPAKARSDFVSHGRPIFGTLSIVACLASWIISCAFCVCLASSLCDFLLNVSTWQCRSTCLKNRTKLKWFSTSFKYLLTNFKSQLGGISNWLNRLPLLRHHHHRLRAILEVSRLKNYPESLSLKTCQAMHWLQGRGIIDTKRD